MNEPADDLDGLLGNPPVSSHDPGRRATTLAATSRVLHRERQFRRVLVAAGVIAAFGAGGVCGWWAKPSPATVVVVTPPEPVASPSNSSPAVAVESLTPEQLEVRAELAEDPAEAARLFREAGDRFLTARRDYENAARCYRRHLAVADDDARKASSSDSWMLHTMKDPVR